MQMTFSGPTSAPAVEISDESTSHKPYHLTSSEWSSTKITSETSDLSTAFAKSDTGQNMSSTCGYKTAYTWPVLTYIGILMIISLVGNSLVLMIFTCRWRSSKGATKVYICALAIIDLTSTLLMMPRELLVLTSYCPSQHSLNLDLDAYCVTTTVGTIACHVASGCVLLLIALRRLMKFRGDNRAFGDPSQIQPTSLFSVVTRLITTGPGAKVMSLAVCVLAFACSSPMLGLYGNNPASHCVYKSSNGTDACCQTCLACGPKRSIAGTSSLYAFNLFTIIIFVIVAGVSILLYALIALRMKSKRQKQQELRKLSRSSHRRSFCRALSEDCPSEKLGQDTDSTGPVSPGTVPTARLLSNNSSNGDDSGGQRAFFPPLSYAMSFISSASFGSLDDRDEGTSVNTGRTSVFSSKSGKSPRQGANTSLVFMLITIVYILSYPPYIVLNYLQLNSKGWCGLRPDYPIAYIVAEVFRRSYMISSAANPLVYVLCNHTFRKVLWKTMHLRRQVI